MDAEKAKAVYETICSMFDDRGWHYEKDEEKLIAYCGVSGEDLPMDFIIQVREKNGTVALISILPFTVPEDKRLDMAVAVCAVNYLLVDGCFDFDISDGQLLFRMNNSYLDVEPDMQVFRYMINCAATTVDEYNDKFLMISKGYIKVSQFLADLNN